MEAKETILLNLGDEARLMAVGKGLSSPKRLALLALLEREPLNINEIAERMKIPPSSAAMHVKTLEEAGLIETILMPGIRGSMKVCKKKAGRLIVSLELPKDERKRTETVSMPVGNFVDYHVEPTCGIVGSDGPIDEEDEPRCFYNPRRTQAQLIWFGKGYVEYRFPNSGLDERVLKRLEVSAELCSETADYDLDYPSDITLWINGLEAGTWHCPSDFGGRRGKLNPDWWPEKNTQYGMLKTWSVDKRGTKLDGRMVSGTKLKDFHLGEKPYISVKIGIREDAACTGGVNLFGEAFGDYPQNILMKFCY